MRESPYYARLPERKTLANGYVFGAPVRDLGWFATLLMGMASGMAAFFAATFIGIVSILFWNANGHRADYAVSYRLVGLPVGLTVMVVALAYLGTFWIKRVFRRR